MSKVHRDSGITLLEILLAIAISSIIGLGLVSLQYILSQNQIAINKSYKSVDDANFILSNFEKEIRRAKSSDNGAYLLNIAGDQEIVFYSDINLDGNTDWVRYYLSDTELIKEIIAPTGYPAIYDNANKKTMTLSKIVRNNSDPVFYYFNEDWPSDTVNNPLVSDDRLSETKTVKMYLRINEFENPEKDFIMETYIQIRSAKENL